MHASRMRTTRSSSRWWGGGLVLIPLKFTLGCGRGSDPPQFPLGCGPGSDPPQFPPWVWAWTCSPSISPLDVDLARGVSLAGGSPCQGGLLGRGVSQNALRQTPPPWTEFLTHASENITLPQTSFAGGKDSRLKM